MITIARILNAFRDAEQFEKPTEDRSKLWHQLIYPQYAFSIFAVPFYMIFTDNVSHIIGAGLVDILISWGAFEYFLSKFRKDYKT